MFMTQYTELWTSLDEIAERIRALDHFAPGSGANWCKPGVFRRNPPSDHVD
jgi:starvation-inducible DNA-binding protein